MRPLLRLIDGLCDLGAAIAALGCAALAVMLIVEVITTSFLAWSQPWAVEYSGYFLCASLFAGSGWALRHGGHIRVTILTQMLPEATRRLADLLATVFAIGVAGFMSWACIDNAIRTWERGTVSYYTSATPLIYPQALLAFGATVLTLALIARALRLLANEAPEAPAPAGSGE